MTDYRPQEQDLIYALDIGTRSVVGVVGKPAEDRLKVLDIEMAEHGKRAMMDGQIDDIQQVAGLAQAVEAVVVHHHQPAPGYGVVRPEQVGPRSQPVGQMGGGGLPAPEGGQLLGR